MSENKQINNKNGFLITCISCIVLLLVMLYFGINSPFKGTRANTVCECNEGDALNGTLCSHTEDQSETYDATEEKVCSCPSGYTEYGDNCYKYEDGQGYSEPKSCETKYTCSRGGRQDGTTCTITKTVTKTYAATCSSESDSDNIPACSDTVINSIGTSCPTEANKTTYVSGGITCDNATCSSHQCSNNGNNATYQVCTYKAPSENPSDIPACSDTVINSIGTSCPTETNKTTYMGAGATCDNATCGAVQTCSINGKEATYKICTYNPNNLPACSDTVVNSIGTSCPTETNKTTYVSGGITCDNANCVSHQCNINGRDATYQVCTYRSPSDKQCTLKYEASCGASFTYTGASTVPSFNDCVISTTHAKYTYTCTNNGKDSDGCIKGSCTVKFAGCDVNYALNSSGECCYCPGCADSPNAPNPTVPTGGGGPVNPSNPVTGGNPGNPGTGGNPGNPGTGGNPNVSENPQTSDILIFIVWVIGLCSICYSLWYYKKTKNTK